LADGATSGLPNAFIRSRAMVWSGTRPRPSRALGRQFRNRIRPAGQYQGQRARPEYAGKQSEKRASASAALALATCAISGLKRGRPSPHRAARQPRHWWRRRRGHKPSRSECHQPAIDEQRAAAAIASLFALSKRVAFDRHGRLSGSVSRRYIGQITSSRDQTPTAPGRRHRLHVEAFRRNAARSRTGFAISPRRSTRCWRRPVSSPPR
jgi:hypothetical protein